MSIVENILGQTDKLVFEAYSDLGFQKKVKGLEKFKVQYNPSEFSVSFGTEFEDIPVENTVSQQKEGEAKAEPIKEKRIKLPEVNFEFVLDGTGASVGISDGFKRIDVVKRIEEFKKLCFVADDKTHQANYVLITYGKLLYKTKFKNVDIKYTLFRNDGYPLRAKINAKFLTVFDTDIQATKLSFNSPDVTHKRTLKEFDTIVAMSNSIYENNYLYQEVAKFNNLNTFRRFDLGTELYFPPLKKQI